MLARPTAGLYIAVIVGFFLAPAVALAHPYYAERVPNPVTMVNELGETRPCINCHNNANGGMGCLTMGGTAPCLNPFGMAFRANGFMWNESLAAADADMDGFTNGQELQDPAGHWRIGDPAPGIPEYHTRPGFPEYNPGRHDDDHDFYCYFGRDANMDGDCADPGENDGALDCDDAVATVNSGATEICTNTGDDDCDGRDTLHDDDCASITDRDGDTYCATGRDMNGDRDCLDTGEMVSVSDCDDTRVTVFPGAPENCSDGVDNDCNGAVDLDDEHCTGTNDHDGDGYCPVGHDLNMDGDCIDVGEMVTTVGDCDDANAAVSPGRTELCTDGTDNDCDGRADLTDVDCGALVDHDHDGHCAVGADMNGDGDCADTGESLGLADCNDMDARVSPSAPEICTNAADDDCDGLVSLADPNCETYLDRDGDRYCFVGFDRDRDGNCAGMDEAGTSGDCDDTRETVNPAAMEVCTDGLDNNCDGSTDAYAPSCTLDYYDFDHDGWCRVGHDLNGDLDCSDAGEQDGPADAASYDATVHPEAGENCFDHKDNDQDGMRDDADTDCTRDHDADADGYCPIGHDLNMDGDCLDDGENAAVSDCEDRSSDIGPATTEVCDDYRDNDCNGDIDLFDRACFVLLDRDHDGFCGRGIDDNGDGDCLDEAEDRAGRDCNDDDAMISPRAREACTDGVDNNCDSRIDLGDAQCLCMMTVTDCNDNNPCTTDRCTADMQDCEHVDDPYCGRPHPDAGSPVVVDAGTGMGGGGGGGQGGGCSVNAGRDTSCSVLAGFVIAALMGARRARRRKTSTGSAR